MSVLVRPLDRISERRGCELIPFHIRANPARQIPSLDTWFRSGAAPNARSNKIRVVPNDSRRNTRFPREQELVVSSRISEQNRNLDPGVTVAVP